MAEEVAKLKELGILNPPNMPGHLPLFPPLVSSSWGKVVSAALGTPPPDLDAYGIGQFLVTDRDEESIPSDSYLDCHSNTIDSSTMWERHIMCSPEREQKQWITKHKDRDGYKSSDKDCDRNRDRECDRSKKNDNRHGSDRPHRHSPQCKDHMVSTAVMASARDHMGMRVHLTTAKQSRGADEHQSITWLQKVAHSRVSTSATSTHVPFNPSSHTSQIVF